MMLRLLLAFLVLPMFARADDDPTWSRIFNDLQVRLFLAPPKAGDDPHHFTLCFQLQRCDDLAQQMQVAFSPATLHLSVVDQDGREIPSGIRSGNLLEGPWDPLVLPHHAFMSIPIGNFTAGSLEFHFWNVWSIPSGPKAYYLEGKFSIPAKTTKEINWSNVNWRGSIDLPKLRLSSFP